MKLALGWNLIFEVAMNESVSRLIALHNRVEPRATVANIIDMGR